MEETYVNPQMSISPKIHKDHLKVIVCTSMVVFLAMFLTLFLLQVNVEEIKSFQYINYLYVIMAFVFVLVLSWILVGFSRRKYVLREKDVTYKSGVLIKTITTVPFSRIQHVEINEGLIPRLFKLATLAIFTAGDSSNDLVIKGIKKEKALKIKEFINLQING